MNNGLLFILAVVIIVMAWLFLINLQKKKLKGYIFSALFGGILMGLIVTPINKAYCELEIKILKSNQTQKCDENDPHCDTEKDE